MDLDKKTGFLLKFAQNLKPTKEQKNEANQSLERLRRIITTQMKKYKVARTVPAGSFKKKTAISAKFDVDLVFFFNVSFEEFLENRCKICSDIEDILTLNEINEVDSNKMSVSCTLNGIDFDILPAVSVVGAENWQQQYKEIRKFINNQPNDQAKSSMHRKLSTSLSEATSEFISGYDSYTHCLCRLAKFWMLMNVPSEVSFTGKSSTIELLAIKAAEETSQEQNILKGYRCFLTMLSQNDKLQIYWTKYYEKNEIPDWIWRQKPLLLDPCDPFNNRFHPFVNDTNLSAGFMKAARNSLMILAHWESNPLKDLSWCCSALLFPPCLPALESHRLPFLTELMSQTVGHIQAWDIEWQDNKTEPILSNVKVERYARPGYTQIDDKTMEHLTVTTLRKLPYLLRAESAAGGILSVPQSFHVGEGVTKVLENSSKQVRAVFVGGNNSGQFPGTFQGNQRNNNASNNSQWDSTIHIPAGDGLKMSVHVRYRC